MVFKVVALIVFIGIVQGHVIPLSLVHPSLQYTIRGPAVHIDPHPVVVSHAVSPWVVPHVIAAHPPAVVEVAAAPSKVVVAAPVVVEAPAAEGSYIAKTRGSEHVAPLPGHANSVTVLNAEPAPGTV